MVSGMDASWSSSTGGNGNTSQSQLYHWRSVQLEASKLLEMGCVLPATLLPHFQMYRWAFVGTEFDVSDKSIPNGMINDENVGQTALYVPHIRRIARLMDMKYTVHSPVSFDRNRTNVLLTLITNFPCADFEYKTGSSFDAYLPANFNTSRFVWLLLNSKCYLSQST